MARESLEAIQAAKTPEELRALLDRALAEYSNKRGLDEHLSHLSEDVRALVTACKNALDAAERSGMLRAANMINAKLKGTLNLQRYSLNDRARIALGTLSDIESAIRCEALVKP